MEQKKRQIWGKKHEKKKPSESRKKPGQNQENEGPESEHGGARTWPSASDGHQIMARSDGML